MANAIALVLLGIFVVIAVVGSLVWLAKRDVFTPDSENQQSPQEREQLEDEVGRQGFSIPYRQRIKTLSGPAKVFFAALGLLTVGVMVATYQILKSGSPAQKYVTQEVQFGAVALVGIMGGVYLEKWFRDQVAYLYVVYQRRGIGDVVDKIPFRRSHLRNTQGSPIVPEVAQNRLFGLFWRFRQLGEDNRLRDSAKPLTDLLEHKIPDHGVETPDGGFIVQTHQDGDEILGGPASVGDITYSSPNVLTDERASEIYERLERLHAENRSIKATNAELYRQIRRLNKKIENEEYHNREDFMDDLDRITDQLEKVVGQMNGSGGDTPSTSVLEDGQEAEA